MTDVVAVQQNGCWASMQQQKEEKVVPQKQVWQAAGQQQQQQQGEGEGQTLLQLQQAREIAADQRTAPA